MRSNNQSLSFRRRKCSFFFPSSLCSSDTKPIKCRLVCHFYVIWLRVDFVSWRYLYDCFHDHLRSSLNSSQPSRTINGSYSLKNQSQKDLFLFLYSKESRLSLTPSVVNIFFHTMLFQPLARSTAIESVSSAFLTVSSSMMNNSRMTSPVQSDKTQASSMYFYGLH